MYDQKCETVYETLYEDKCETVYESQCSTVYEDKCETRLVIKIGQYYRLVQGFRVTAFLLVNTVLKVMAQLQVFVVNILIWRISKLLLPHNLYYDANHIPLFYCSCWHPFIVISQTQYQWLISLRLKASVFYASMKAFKGCFGI